MDGRHLSTRRLGLFGGLFVLALLAPPARAQDHDDALLARLEGAFAQGDVAALLEEAAERLDLTVLGASAVYSRAQAQYVMENFFRDHPPVRFRFQDPSRRDENWFAAGQYVYGSEEHALWIYVRLRWQGARWELREIRIDRRAGP